MDRAQVLGGIWVFSFRKAGQAKQVIAISLTTRHRTLKMKGLLLILPFLLASPALAGDLGLNDEKLAGIGNSMQRQRYDQTEFLDREGTLFTFTQERLTAKLSEKRKRWIQEKNIRKLGKINFEEASKEAYITPDQVISYDYFLQKGTGLYFKIFYKTRNGGKSLASIQITDENKSKSFHNTFILWVSGKLEKGAQLEEQFSFSSQ